VTTRVAITGATGFVGLALCERLRAEGAEVAGLVRETSAAAPREALQRLGVRMVVGDVTQPESLPALIDGADLVFHCAAVIGYRKRLAGAMARINVIGSADVAATCRLLGVGRMVHVSSIAAIGVTDEPVLMNEDTPFNAGPLRAPYFDTKHEAEERVLAEEAAGLDAVVVNPGAIYGPSLVGSNSNQLVTRIARGRLKVAPEGGMNVVTLRTVVDGCLAAARVGRRGRRYVLGCENLGLDELLVRVAGAAGITLRPRRFPTSLGPLLRAAMTAVEPLVPDRVWYTPDLCAAFGKWMWFDTRRMREELDVQPEDLDECLAATVESLRRSGALSSR
jgi:dihydroflavonol-4-reductase